MVTKLGRTLTRREFFALLLAPVFRLKYWPQIRAWFLRTFYPTTIAKWDPALIAMVSKSFPNLLANQICGVQPMCGPTGMVFAMRSEYVSKPRTARSKNEEWCATPMTWKRRDLPLSVVKDRGWCLELHKNRIYVD